ncbi:15353_t:CDS:2 [Entrophospora sp. SA101]|nr:15353_t:CDS:2 [Entrophospora sp. SA101]
MVGFDFDYMSSVVVVVELMIGFDCINFVVVVVVAELVVDLENQVAEVKVLRQRLRDFEILKDELQNAKKQVRENETLSENLKSEINRLHMKNQDSQQESISKSEEISQLLVRIEDLNRDLNSAREQIKDNQKNAVELLQARTEINELKSQMRETEEKNRLFIEKLQSQSSKATSFEPLSREEEATSMKIVLEHL